MHTSAGAITVEFLLASIPAFGGGTKPLTLPSPLGGEGTV